MLKTEDKKNPEYNRFGPTLCGVNPHDKNNTPQTDFIYTHLDGRQEVSRDPSRSNVSSEQINTVDKEESMAVLCGLF